MPTELFTIYCHSQEQWYPDRLLLHALGSMYRFDRRTGKKYIQTMSPLHTAHLLCINFQGTDSLQVKIFFHVP
jgi:hypothetical protein